jgi:hypothetical protein
MAPGKFREAQSYKLLPPAAAHVESVKWWSTHG